MGQISKDPKELIPFLNRKLFEKGDCYSPGTGFCLKQDYKVYLAPAELNLDLLGARDIYTFKEMLDENGSPDVEKAPDNRKLEMSRYSKLYLYLLEEFNCECILVAQSQCTTLAGDLYSDMLVFSNKECLTNVRISTTSERLNYTDKLHIPIIDFKSDQSELITDITNAIYSNMPTCACIVKGFGLVIIGDNWTYVRNIFETIKDLINNELAYQQYRVRRDIGHQMSFINNNISALLHTEKSSGNQISSQSPEDLRGVSNENVDFEQVATGRDPKTTCNDTESGNNQNEDENIIDSNLTDPDVNTNETTDKQDSETVQDNLQLDAGVSESEEEPVALCEVRIKTEKEDSDRDPEAETYDEDLNEDLDESDDVEDCVGHYWTKPLDFQKNQAAKMMLFAANQFFDAFVAGKPPPKTRSLGPSNQQSFSIILEKIEEQLNAAKLTADEKVKGTRLARLTYGCQKCQQCMLYKEAIGNSVEDEATPGPSTPHLKIKPQSKVYKTAQMAVDTCLRGELYPYSKLADIPTDSKKSLRIFDCIEHILDQDKSLSLEDREVARIRLRRIYAPNAAQNPDNSKNDDAADKGAHLSKATLKKYRAHHVVTQALENKDLPDLSFQPGSKKSKQLIQLVQKLLEERKVNSTVRWKIVQACWKKYGVEQNEEHAGDGWDRGQARKDQESPSVRASLEPPSPRRRPSSNASTHSSSNYDSMRGRERSPAPVTRRVVERKGQDYDFRTPQGQNIRQKVVHLESAMNTAFTKYFNQLSSNIINERVMDDTRDYSTRQDHQHRPSTTGSWDQWPHENRGDMNYQQASSGPIFQMASDFHSPAHRGNLVYPQITSNYANRAQTSQDYTTEDDLHNLDLISLQQVLSEEITKMVSTKKATNAKGHDIREVSTIMYSRSHVGANKMTLIHMISELRKCRNKLNTVGPSPAPSPAKIANRKRALSSSSQASSTGGAGPSSEPKRKMGSELGYSCRSSKTSQQSNSNDQNTDGEAKVLGKNHLRNRRIKLKQKAKKAARKAATDQATQNPGILSSKASRENESTSQPSSNTDEPLPPVPTHKPTFNKDQDEDTDLLLADEDSSKHAFG